MPTSYSTSSTISTAIISPKTLSYPNFTNFIRLSKQMITFSCIFSYEYFALGAKLSSVLLIAHIPTRLMNQTNLLDFGLAKL